MNHADIIHSLKLNKEVFASMFNGLSKEEILWRPQPERWCLLEIVCHLYDEERQDFRYRLKHTLETPDVEFPKIDPQAWVKERNYMEKNFNEMFDAFLRERDHSLQWLNSLQAPRWNNKHVHPKFGEMSAEMFLSNWLAHDYLHFRQITYTKYQYLKHHVRTRFDYAGDW